MHLAVAVEHHSGGHLIFNQLHAQQPVINVAKVRASHSGHGNLNAVGVQIIKQRLQKNIGPVVVVETGKYQINTQRAQRVLLQQTIVL
jgi:hypothetical protein